MREIKFRIWHKKVREIIYDDIPGDSMRWKYNERQPAIIMQYTGLPDKIERPKCPVCGGDDV